MDKNDLHIGVVGAGGFARFAIQAFIKVPGVKVIAVTDINEKAAWQMGKDLELEVYPDLDTLLANENINLVYIATPPSLHYLQSKRSLLAGKHVICEKPAGLKTSEVEELVAIAQSGQVLYVVNLMQRYNPLFEIVKMLIQDKILGNFLHGFFENYASDEFLHSEHWFWDETKSGGIFIEHGVHFFDLFAGWLGGGKVVSSLRIKRPAIKEAIIDRVQATVLYTDGIVNFYHGFDQPKILDRQEMRLQFERGEITLFEWVPVKMKLHGLFKKHDLKKVDEMTQGFEMVKRIVHFEPHDKVKGRFIEILFDDHLTIEYENSLGKQELYQQMLTDMIKDQWNWIKNREHHPIINGNNAIQSLSIAEQSTVLAQNF